MIKEAIDRLLELNDPQTVTIDGREYFKKGYSQATPPTPAILEVMNLDGFVDFVKTGFAAKDFENVSAIVESPTLVTLVSQLNKQYRTREKYVQATRSKYVDPFPFAQFMTTERLIVGLKSLFAETKELADLVRLVGNVKSESSIKQEDDGFTQTIETRAGVHLRAQETLPNPIKLKPFRTFNEVDQPESLFLVRAQEGRGGHPEFALFEADGGAWKIDAIKNVKKYLTDALSEFCPVIG